MRDPLPQLDRGGFIADGGLETTLIYHQGFDLPEFAAFVLLDDEAGLAGLRAYYAPYVELAGDRGVTAVLDTPTWRASLDWGAKLGYSPGALADVNRRAVELLDHIRATSEVEILISGAIGPRGDGYVVGSTMTAETAQRYHAPQVDAFADAAADLVSAVTMTYAAEAIGIARAAAVADVHAVISFTVETDGRLPSGQPLGDAIEEVDAATDRSVAYYMVNCAHPTHFAHVLEGGWTDRVRGIRANASKLSHAELDAAEELDAGDPAELASGYAALRERLPNLNVVGGCCGTDHRHVGAIAAALAA
jgi:S-methylmethionine-dependent homocysteine/selenocysteine methylase